MFYKNKLFLLSHSSKWERGYLAYVFLFSPHKYMLWVLRSTSAMLMSTNNICVHGEVRKISALFGWKKCLIRSYKFMYVFQSCSPVSRVWLGEATVSCILRHREVQLILAYSWARPIVLAAGKGRGWMFLFLLFLHSHSFSSPHPSLLSPLLSLLSLFSLSSEDDTKWPTRVAVSSNPNIIKSLLSSRCCKNYSCPWSQRLRLWSKTQPAFYHNDRW